MPKHARKTCRQNSTFNIKRSYESVDTVEKICDYKRIYNKIHQNPLTNEQK